MMPMLQVLGIGASGVAIGGAGLTLLGWYINVQVKESTNTILTALDAKQVAIDAKLGAIVAVSQGAVLVALVVALVVLVQRGNGA